MSYVHAGSWTFHHNVVQGWHSERFCSARNAGRSECAPLNELQEKIMAVQPIPEGFRTITPHLIAKNAGQALEFYKKAFGAEEICRMPGPDGKSVMHAQFKIGDSMLMIADEFP